jgi:hypothetical protein
VAEILVQVVAKQTDGEGYLKPTLPVGPESFRGRAKDIADGVATVANSVRDDLEAALSSPAKSAYELGEIELKFSLDLEAEAGVVIARAKTTAGFEVSLKWTRRPT